MRKYCKIKQKSLFLNYFIKVTYSVNFTGTKRTTKYFLRTRRIVFFPSNFLYENYVLFLTRGLNNGFLYINEINLILDNSNIRLILRLKT